jgi:hypothetical protein
MSYRFRFFKAPSLVYESVLECDDDFEALAIADFFKEFEVAIWCGERLLPPPNKDKAPTVQ